jgi:serine/threonine protein kinase
VIRRFSYIIKIKIKSCFFSRTNDIQGGGIERLYHRVGTKLYMPPELLDKNTTFNFDRINAYQQGDMYSLALVFWEIGNVYCSINHIRPYENQLPINFTIDQLIQLVCIEQKRPISCINPSDKVRKKKNINKIDFLF